ncbi:MAG: hypothetical protein SFU99_23200 [Saprospiraceae bacterium]|nr:hypothetical protein [Saprospiraceae bacterium]
MIVFGATDTIPTPFGIKIDLSPESKNWREFNSYDGRFSILSPGEMKEKIDSIQTPIGILTYHTFFFQANQENADNVLYMLSYCDYPEGSMHSDSTELLQEFFDATLESATASVKGELMYERNAKYKNYPGKIWRIDYLDGKALIKTKAFVIERRYYTIQTITRKDRSLNFSSEKFLDSFKLLE